jgi:ribonuclease III
MKSSIEKFIQTNNLNFNDIKLLKQAFTHRSYINEHRSLGLEHNERLEFLGDAVLEMVITDFLFRHYPDKTEGDLTAFRAAAVNTTTLSEAATDLGMNDYLLLSKGEAKDVGRARQVILANTFESVIGAIYLDQGYQAATSFIGQALFDKVGNIIDNNLWRDAKSIVQEKIQETQGVTPAYEVIKEVGPDHKKRFTVGLYANDQKLAEGSGHSKQGAEQQAAASFLDQIDSSQ